MQEYKEKARWLSRLQRITLKELYNNSPMHKIELVWRVAEKYEGTKRITEIRTPKKISSKDIATQLLEILEKTVIKNPKLPERFSASFSRSLKSLERRGLIEVYKNSSGVKIRITEDGKKVVEKLD